MKLTGLLKEGTEQLGLRFTLLGILPSILLIGFLLGMSWSGAPANAPEINNILERMGSLGMAEGMALALGILILAIMAHPFQYSLVRILEGYWPRPLDATLGKLGIAWHKWRREKLDNATEFTPREEAQIITPRKKAQMLKALWKLQRRYPSEDRLLPMALGNALRAAEDRAYNRYRLDAVAIWPRLYPLLSDQMRTILTDRRNQLDVAARFCVVFVVIAAAAIWFLHPYWDWLAGVAGGSLTMAWLSYRGAVSAAVAYGESIQAAFDLHRFDLYAALHLPVQPNLVSERNLNCLLTDFLNQGIDSEVAPYDVSSMSIDDLRELPGEGYGLVIVAEHRKAKTLHFRIFDTAGGQVVDKSETEFPNKSTELEELKRDLSGLQGKPSLNDQEKSDILRGVASITGHTQWVFKAIPYSHGSPKSVF